MGSDHFDPIGWDGAADFAVAALPPVDLDAGEAALGDERLHSAWQIYEMLVAAPGTSDLPASPVVRTSPGELARALAAADGTWPLSCTYATCLFDDDIGRRLEQYFGPVLPPDERRRALDPDERRHTYLAMLPPRPIAELFPLASLCAACTIGDAGLFDRALAAGADPAGHLMEGRGGRYVTYRRYPLVLAIEAGQAGMVERLLDAGADPATLDHADWRTAERLREQPRIAETIMAHGYPPSNAAGLPGPSDWERQRLLGDDQFIAASLSAGAFTDEDYPAAALRAGAEGSVVVDIWVASSRPSGCRVVASSGDRDLDERTCAIILDRFYFNAAQGRFLPKPVTVRQTVRWRIAGD